MDCKWSDFSAWGECSQSCGSGTQVRERSILMLPRNGGRACRGDARQRRPCNTFKCPRRFTKWKQTRTISIQGPRANLVSRAVFIAYFYCCHLKNRVLTMKNLLFWYFTLFLIRAYRIFIPNCLKIHTRGCTYLSKISITCTLWYEFLNDLNAQSYFDKNFVTKKLVK